MKNKSAFTLAEAIITIGVIGVVAAILLPTLVREVTQKVDSSREANVAMKITKAMENMSATGDFTKFNSTDDFVDVLQKYLKIAKRCNAENLEECWPTKKITTSDGEELQIKDMKKGRHLNKPNNTTDNVGLVLTDGASLLLTYNQDFIGNSSDKFFKAYTKNLPVGFGKYKDFAYSSSVTEPIDYVIDVNGKTPPNREKSETDTFDIRSFNTARFSRGCPGVVVSGLGCVFELASWGYVDCSAETESNSSDYKKYCQDPPGLADDRWAGARKACAEIEYGSDVPTNAQFKEISKQRENYPYLSNLTGNYWGSSYTSTRAYRVDISSGNTCNGFDSPAKSVSAYKAICFKPY